MRATGGRECARAQGRGYMTDGLHERTISNDSKGEQNDSASGRSMGKAGHRLTMLLQPLVLQTTATVIPDPILLLLHETIPPPISAFLRDAGHRHHDKVVSPYLSRPTPLMLPAIDPGRERRHRPHRIDTDSLRSASGGGKGGIRRGSLEGRLDGGLSSFSSFRGSEKGGKLAPNPSGSWGGGRRRSKGKGTHREKFAAKFLRKRTDARRDWLESGGRSAPEERTELGKTRHGDLRIVQTGGRERRRRQREAGRRKQKQRKQQKQWLYNSQHDRGA